MLDHIMESQAHERIYRLHGLVAEQLDLKTRIEVIVIQRVLTHL